MLLAFEFHRQAAGSLEIWFNLATRRYTTILNHPSEMPEGTLRAVLKQADVQVPPAAGLLPLKERLDQDGQRRPVSGV